MASDKKLSEAVQRAIGAGLRDHYRDFVNCLPLNLVGLAHRVEGTRSTLPAPFNILHAENRELHDPLTVRILVEAFDKAWRDLESLNKNPTTQNSLALLLLEILKEGEQNPSRLASKAVLRLLSPA